MDCSMAPIDKDHIAYILDGGIANTQKRRYIENLTRKHLDQQPNRTAANGDETSQLSLIQNVSEKFTTLRELIMRYNLRDADSIYWLQRAFFQNDFGPMENLIFNYSRGFQLSASDEQMKIWLPRIRNFEVFGNFAQTELGHGSFVRGLETTATFEPSTQSFLINSPTLSSIKWWNGTVPGFAKYAVVVANLISKGKQHGLAQFMVPLWTNHRITEGLEFGDIGPTFGCQGVTHPYFKFTNVSIPLDHLLNRSIKVCEDGSVKMDPKSILSTYLGQTRGRCMIVHFTARAVAEATSRCITHCRNTYHLIQRGSGETENLLLYNEQTMQDMLMPALAQSLVFWFTAISINKMMNDLKTLASPDIKTLHALSCGLKAYTTTEACRTIQQCCTRIHDPILTPALHKLYTNTAALVTADGDPTVLIMQTAKYLAQIAVGEVIPSAEFFFLIYSDRNTHISNLDLPDARCLNISSGNLESSNMQDYIRKLLHIVQSLHRIRAASYFQKTKHCVHEMKSRGISLNTIMYSNQVVMVEMAEVLITTHLVCSSLQYTQSLSSGNKQQSRALSLIQLTCGLFGLDMIIKYSGDFIEDHILTPHQTKLYREQYLNLIQQLSSLAPTVCDAFDFPLVSELKKYSENQFGQNVNSKL